MTDTNPTDKLGSILRAALRRALDEDCRRRIERPVDRPVYADWWEPGDAKTAAEADLQIIRATKADFDRYIAENWSDDLMDCEADDLIREHNLPPKLRPALIHGLLEVARRRREVAELRNLGKMPVVLQPDVPQEAVSLAPAPVVVAQSTMSASPMPEVRSEPPVVVSALVESFFERRERVDRTTHQVLAQERGTLRRFIEAVGDRAPAAYRRADVFQFLDTLRRLPATYGKSPKDKERSLDDLIADADAKQADRLTDKTVKRYLSVLSQFSQLAVDRGHLTVVARAELVGAIGSEKAAALATSGTHGARRRSSSFSRPPCGRAAILQRVVPKPEI